MEQSNASALELRETEDKGGFGENRQVKAYSGKATRQKGAFAHARGQGKRLETHNGREVDQEATTWEMRCAELGLNQWQRVSGLTDAWRTARIWADAIDHDASRPIAWGKMVTIEMRRLGRSHALKFEVTGQPVYRYHVKQVYS